MSKEKVIYRCRYEESYRDRRKIPYMERGLQLLRETRFGNSLNCYQVLGSLKVSDMLKIEELMEGKFPFRVRGGQDDLIGEQIANAFKRTRED